jgi:hypothetical protein
MSGKEWRQTFLFNSPLQKKCNTKDLSRSVFLSYEATLNLSQGPLGGEEGQADGQLQFEILALRNKV